MGQNFLPTTVFDESIRRINFVFDNCDDIILSTLAMARCDASGCSSMASAGDQEVKITIATARPEQSEVSPLPRARH